MKLMGIDFGSKKAGTTAIAYLNDSTLHFEQSKKGEDADLFLRSRIAAHQPHLVGIDAPLSLPAVYTNGGNDYFYRKADRTLKAMSPMFLGGLTARAIKLKDWCKARDMDCHEVYPAGAVEHAYPGLASYKSDLKEANDHLLALTQLTWKGAPANWHQYDACLAYLTLVRLVEGRALSFGDANEGIMLV